MSPVPMSRNVTSQASSWIDRVAHPCHERLDPSGARGDLAGMAGRAVRGPSELLVLLGECDRVTIGAELLE